MKKFISSLVLLVLIFSGMGVMQACKKEQHYSMANFQTDFEKLAEDRTNVDLEDGKLTINYSNSIGSGQTLQNLVDSSTGKYKNLKFYQYVLDNSLSFVYEHIELASTDSLTDDGTKKDKIKSDINEIASMLNSLTENIGMLSDMISLDSEDSLTSARYNALLNSFSRLCIATTNLSMDLSNILLINPNPYAKSSLDVELLVGNLNSRISYQKSMLTQTYIEMYLNDAELSKSVANGEKSIDLIKYDYKSNVEAINYHVDVQNGIINANSSTDFETKIKSAYAMQVALDNDMDKYLKASNSINYPSVKSSEQNSNRELQCLTIIENQQALLSEYNAILVDILGIVM